MSEAVEPAPAVPEWLARTLQDKTLAPRIYRWTPDDVAGQQGSTLGKPWPVPGNKSNHDNSKRIYIVGAGNLGRLFAASLARLPNPPPITLVVHRPGLLEHWRDTPGVVLHPPGYAAGTAGDRITNVDIEMWSETPPPSLAASEAEIPPIANLVITTKAQDALQTADWLRRYLQGPGAAVAFAQNGMNKLWPPYGALYDTARYSSSSSSSSSLLESKETHPPMWLACVVTHGVYSVGPFASVHASPADVVLGAVGEDVHNGNEAGYLVQQILASSQLNARWAARHELWVLQLEKLVVNAVINPLTAILRCKNGALFEAGNDGGGGGGGGGGGHGDDNVKEKGTQATSHNAILSPVIDRLLAEASAVLRALAQHEIERGSLFRKASSSSSTITDTTDTTDTTETAAAAAARTLADRLSFDSLRAMVYRVGELVKDNSSSMLQDAQAGKTTEVREFNGWIVDMARYLASVSATDGKTVDVAAHQLMVDLVEKAVPLTQEELGAAFSSTKPLLAAS
ncbi:MAG: 2-dehydropantoate 2-reductase (Ketopantoate reductase) (KPA reductase) (KPR) [Sporothrix thermara]